jgi:hypothetical protein
MSTNAEIIFNYYSNPELSYGMSEKEKVEFSIHFLIRWRFGEGI